MTILEQDQPFRLVVGRDLEARPERVWRALTDRHEIAAWFFPLDFEAAVGHGFRITGPAVPGWRGWTACEVLALDPPRRMVWSFACWEGPPSIVTFDVLPRPEGCRLRITHHGRVPPDTLGLLDAGWSQYADQLAGTLGD